MTEKPLPTPPREPSQRSGEQPAKARLEVLLDDDGEPLLDDDGQSLCVEITGDDPASPSGRQHP